MAAMAAAIPGSIFDVTGNPAPGPADPAVERDAAAARARPHHHRLTAPASATRPDASAGKRDGIAGGIRDHLMPPPIQIRRFGPQGPSSPSITCGAHIGHSGAKPCPG